MELVPGGPGGESADDLIRRMNARLDGLRGATPFDVAGLLRPELLPGFLAEAGSSNDQWHAVCLFYGDGTRAGGPSISVRSAIQRRSGAVEPDLVDLLAKERNRIFDHAGIDEPDPTAMPRRQATTLRIGDTAYPFDVHDEGDLWAARTELPFPKVADDARLLVTLLARGQPIDAIDLVWVRDLSPFIDEREQFLASMIDRQRTVGPEPSDLDVVEGEDALRIIVDYCLEESNRSREERSSGRRQNYPRSSGRRRHALWQAAARYQAEVWGQDEVQANEQVTSMINHLTRLNLDVPWFSNQPHSRESAIRETLAFTAHGESVASGPAQRAWLTLWKMERGRANPSAFLSGRPVGAEHAATLLAGARDLEELRSEWLGAWEQWIDAQAGPA
jgi:hypothetical protein